jgi:hypothetical protein
MLAVRKNETANIQQRTAKAEVAIKPSFDVRRWLLEVRCFHSIGGQQDPGPATHLLFIPLFWNICTSPVQKFVRTARDVSQTPIALTIIFVRKIVAVRDNPGRY